jgi:hypothetical protein
MSVVTNVILCAGAAEDGYKPLPETDGIKFVNDWLRDLRPDVSHNALVNIEAPDNGNWYGGTKRLECSIWVGAFNYLPVEEFVERVKAAPWRDKESVQLFIKEDDDQLFRERVGTGGPF